MSTLIALSGYARSGKDTVGNYLVEQHGFVRLAFADKLKDALYALNPIVYQAPPIQRRVQDLVDEMGWDNAKTASPEIRSLLQRIGTEVGRETFWSDFWVDLVRQRIEIETHTNFVITDCRFPNEAGMVANRGGEVWRVERPGTEPVNAHPSETAIDDWSFDRRIDNSGDIGFLRRCVDFHLARSPHFGEVGTLP